MGDLFDRSVHPLYSVCAFVCATIVILILNSGRKNIYVKNKNHEHLFKWVIFFCLQDGIWGVFASHVINNPTLLYVFSFVFHFSAITSTVVWVRYFLSRVEGKVKYGKVYQGLTFVLLFIQYAMLIGNAFTKFMFYVDDGGWYCTTDYRAIMFYMQMMVYVVMMIATITAYIYSKDSNSRKESLSAIIAVNSAPLLFGFFQMIYPDAPSDSLGFSIAVVIIYTYLMIDYEKQVTSLKELQDQLNIALHSAEEANKAKTTFLFNMSHDIRTPMNAILGFANIAEKHINEKDRVEDSVKKIKVAGSQLLDIINDILEMSRIDSGKMEIITAPVDLRKIINDIAPMLESLAIDKSIMFHYDDSGINNRYVHVDVNHLNRLITNVTTNAIKYTNTGGKVSLSVDEIEEKDGIATYRIIVADTGVGMSKEFMAHLFEQFSRERTSTVSKQQGTGLGLSIVKHITDAFGGTISVNSEKDKGTTFTIDIPLKLQSEEEIIKNHSFNITQDTPYDSSMTVGKKILVVEDNDMNREIVIDLLEDVGFKVDTATDGQFAVETIKEKGAHYYDYVLMDIQMPVMDGYEATRNIRMLEDGNDVVIIAFSANAFEEDKKRSLDAGMNGHIAKPIDLNQMIETLKEFDK